jgi:leader peptidase (prepilin peptidase)/N-methyltransferase
VLWLAGLIGALIGVLIDRGAARWQPPVTVPAAMGATAVEPANGWTAWLPIVGWLPSLIRGRAGRLTVMRLVTELIGAVAFVGLALAGLPPWLLLLRAALIVDLLLILRLDWQFHLIHDRTIIAGLLLATAAGASQSTGQLLGVLLAGLGAGLAFLFFYLLARWLYGQAALGFGDVLLAGLIGAAVGPAPAAVFGTLFLGMVLAVIGGLVISVRRRTLRTYFAYGTYLAAATIITLATPTQAGQWPSLFG